MKKTISKTINKGFSLMEVMIWGAIAALFSTLVGIAGFSYLERQKVTKAVNDVNIFSVSILDYYSSSGNYPTNEEGLKILVDKGYINKNSDKNNGKDNETLLDPWGNEYMYSLNDNGSGFTIKSLGSDKKEGGTGNAKDIIITQSDKSEDSIDSSEK
jgi:general secretion pathway protein G